MAFIGYSGFEMSDQGVPRGSYFDLADDTVVIDTTELLRNPERYEVRIDCADEDCDFTAFPKGDFGLTSCPKCGNGWWLLSSPIQS